MTFGVHAVDIGVVYHMSRCHAEKDSYSSDRIFSVLIEN